MTFLNLQDALLLEIEKTLKDMVSETADDVQKIGFKGYANALPPILTDDESEEQYFPYFIVRLSSGHTEDDNDCWHVSADIILGVQEKDNRGHSHILIAIQRIVDRFTEDPKLGSFRADQSIDWVLSEEDTEPYYYGAVSITFSVPKTGRRPAYG